MSENQKCLNMIRGGMGGQQFSKKAEIQKNMKFPMGGGGVKPILEFFPNFSVFFYDKKNDIKMDLLTFSYLKGEKINMN